MSTLASAYKLTKQDSQNLKGIAIILMLFHHLYGAYSIPSHIVPNNFPYYSTISIACKVCVPIFVIITGYGFSATLNSSKNNFLYSGFKKFFNFYKIYLIYSILCLTILTLFPNDAIPTVRDYFYTITGLSPYFPDWWYIKVFAFCCLFYYPFFAWVDKKNSKIQFIFSILFIIFSLTLRIIGQLFANKMGNPNLSFCITEITKISPYIIFIPIGWYWNKLTQESSIYKKTYKTILTIYIITILFTFSLKQDYIYIVALLGTIIISYPIIRKMITISKILNLFGLYSLHMWLNHRFIFGYWFKEYFYSLPILTNYIILIIFSFILAYLTNKFIKAIFNIQNNRKIMIKNFSTHPTHEKKSLKEAEMPSQPALVEILKKNGAQN